MRLRRRCRHEAVRIVHAYHETEQPTADLVTIDGQHIEVAFYECKCRCPCGRMWLQELPLVRFGA